MDGSNMWLDGLAGVLIGAAIAGLISVWSTKRSVNAALRAAQDQIAAANTAMRNQLEFQKEQERIKLAIDMSKEFNSPEMLNIRTQAQDFLAKNPNIILPIVSIKSRHESKPLWVVILFFERLSTATEHNLVNEDLIFDMFGEIFMTWYNELSGMDFPQTHTHGKQQIEWFRKWLTDQGNKSDANKNAILQWKKGSAKRWEDIRNFHSLEVSDSIEKNEAASIQSIKASPQINESSK